MILPQCRYRADVAAYRPERNGLGSTAIFECKQTLPDLRRDNCCSTTTHERLESVWRRRQVLEKHLRVHYPNLRIADTLFPEFDLHDFAAIEHRGYARVLRELNALHNRLYDCTKFEKLVRYRCANLLYLVLPNELFRDSEVPAGWGSLVELDGALGRQLAIAQGNARLADILEGNITLYHRNSPLRDTSQPSAPAGSNEQR